MRMRATINKISIAGKEVILDHPLCVEYEEGKFDEALKKALRVTNLIEYTFDGEWE